MTADASLRVKGRNRAQRIANLHSNWRRYHAKRQRGLCAICGKPMPDDDVTLDHVIPLSKGGADTFKNTRATHKICNWMKGDVPPAGFNPPVVSPRHRRQRP